MVLLQKTWSQNDEEAILVYLQLDQGKKGYPKGIEHDKRLDIVGTIPLVSKNGVGFDTFIEGAIGNGNIDAPYIVGIHGMGLGLVAKTGESHGLNKEDDFSNAWDPDSVRCLLLGG